MISYVNVIGRIVPPPTTNLNKHIGYNKSWNHILIHKSKNRYSNLVSVPQTHKATFVCIM